MSFGWQLRPRETNRGLLASAWRLASAGVVAYLILDGLYQSCTILAGPGNRVSEMILNHRSRIIILVVSTKAMIQALDQIARYEVNQMTKT